MAKAEKKAESKVSKDPIMGMMQDISKVRNLPMNVLLPIVEDAFSKAFRSSMPDDDVEAYYDEARDEFRAVKIMHIVDEPERRTEISLKDAKKLLKADNCALISGEVIENALVEARQAEYERLLELARNAGPDAAAGGIRSEEELEPANVELDAKVMREVKLSGKDTARQGSADTAKAAAVGDYVWELVPLDTLGRIAVQTLKQTMNSKMIDAEHKLIYDEFNSKFNSLVRGTVVRIDKRKRRRRGEDGREYVSENEYNDIIYVDVDGREAILLPQDQILYDDEPPVDFDGQMMRRYKPGFPKELYSINSNYFFAIREIKKNNKRPQVYLTRSDAKLVRLLFAKEVPEVASGEVVIESVAREAGSRTKLTVHSLNPNIDAIGACIGPKAIRLDNIRKELCNEEIDLVAWNENPAILIANAIKPATVSRVELYEEENTKHALVVVPDEQLSLAIGRRGQNARLAVKVTGWNKIDIKSESQYAEMQNDYFDDEYEDEDYEDGYEEDIDGLDHSEE